MNSEERTVIDGIFKRLEQAASQPRDADAERFIADKLRAQPYAPYAMAQLIYVQEEAIKSLNEQLEQARAQAQPAQPEGSGGFLSSIFGGGQRPAAQPARPAGSPWGAPTGAPGYGQQQPPQGYGQPQQPQQGGPWGGGGYAQQQAPQRSGFLGSALTTAAGVAGGMVVGSALMNAFSGGHHSLGGLTGAASAGDLGSGSMFGSSSDVSSSDFGSPLHGGDSGVQDAGFDPSLDDSSFDDGGDSGGGDDWV